MNVEQVGEWRYCPACARPLLPPRCDSEDPDDEHFDYLDPRCSCCQRPWSACPCTPASEGECRSMPEGQAA